MLLALAGMAAWIVLTFFWGRFWRDDQTVSNVPPINGWTPSEGWPSVAIIVPARDEADVIERSLGSLLAQDYPGPFSVTLIDDNSSDGTREISERVADPAGRLRVLTGAPLQPGWTGKLWALHQGIEQATDAEKPDLLWMSDADIALAPDLLRRLVAKLQAEDRDMVSVMAALDTRGAWARLLIPAFIYFFQKLYPFPWVNNPKMPIAAAAGGCVLVQRDALEASGGYAAMRDALIDDVTLGSRIKRRSSPRPGRIWLGFAGGVTSLRPSQSFADIWMMVARTAFTQLFHSVRLLIGTMFGMVLVYLVPPFTFIHGLFGGDPVIFLIGAASWGLMVLTFVPTLRRYGQPAWLAVALPIAGALYTAMTVDSARRYWQGKGGEWKGRAQAVGSENARSGDA